ncbi:hypothetical protein RUR49_19965 [Pseudoxanthobacter sp. M-2]|uniref:hypothetical protein n=1 Tax=Pseudoxanthobacter sp. M-2 TaxID=3078754 RepID=UPI0038FC8750
MLGIGLPVGAAGAYRAIDPDAAAYASAMTVAPSAARVALFDAFVRAIKAGGLWTRLDLLYLLAAHDEQAGRVNLIAPGAHTCTAVNSPSFVADRGFAGDGATSYLSTGLNPSLGGTRFAQNDATLFVWSLTDLNASAAEIGTGSATRLLARSFGALAARANTTTSTTVAVADSLGLVGWSRTSSAGHDFFRGGTVVASPVQASDQISAGVVRIGAAASTYSARRLAVAGVGAGLDGGQIAALDAACEAYLDAVGALP